MKLKVLKNKELIMTILLLIIGALAINYTFFKPTKINFYIASKLYKTPANPAFTDDNFYKCVVDEYNRENGVDKAYTEHLTDEELKKITTLSMCYNKGIVNTDGLEKLTAITTINLSYNKLASLDVSNNPILTELNVSTNQLTSLYVSNNSQLKTLKAGNNQLTNLDVRHNQELKSLEVYHNELIDIDISGNPLLKTLYVYDNQLTNLDVSNNPNLETLYVNINPLISLDVSSNFALKELIASNLQLTSLDTSNNIALKELSINKNKLTSLDISNNPELEILYARENEITSISFSSTHALKKINLDDNQLTSLDVSNGSALEELRISNNKLTSIKVSDNHILSFLDISHNELTNLDLSTTPALTKLNVVRNKLTSLDVSNNPNLQTLNSNNNQLTSLDVSSSVALKTLIINNNLLTNIDVSEAPVLEELNVLSNQLTVLDVSNNPNLQMLNSNNNRLINIDLSNNPNLSYLYAGNNQLTNLDVSEAPVLEELNVQNNQLTELDVSNNPILKKLYANNNRLTNIDLSNNLNLSYLYAGNNQFASLDLSKNINLSSNNIYITNNISSKPVYVYKGDNIQLSNDVKFPSGITVTNDWVSDDNNTAKVDNDGLVTANKTGTATITNKIKESTQYLYSYKHILNIVEIKSYKYIVNDVDNYIYVGNDSSIDTIIDNIITPENITLNVNLDNNVLQVKHNDDIIKEFQLIRIISDEYNLTNDYIYVGKEALDLTKINVINGTIREEDSNLQIKHNDKIIKTLDIVSILSDVYDITDDCIYIGNEKFDLTNINVTNAKIIKQGTKLQITYNENILKEYILISISSDVYEITKDYIYLGKEELDLTKINVTNAEIIKGETQIKLKYNNQIIKTINIVSIWSDEYDLSDNYIYVGTEELDLTKINIINAIITQEGSKLQIKCNEEIIKTYDIVSISSDAYNLTKSYVYVGTEELDLTKINVTNGTILEEVGKLKVKQNDKIIKEYDIVSISSDVYNLTKSYIYVGIEKLDLTKINMINAIIVEEDRKLKVKYNDEVLKEFEIISISSEIYDLAKNYIYIGTEQLDLTKINITNATVIEESGKLKIKYKKEVLKDFDIVSISSEIYYITNEFIYIGTEQLDLTKINVTNAEVVEEDNQLQVKYNDETVRSFDISKIYGQTYIFFEDNIFIGTEQLDLTKLELINLENGVLIEENEKIKVKYREQIIYEYKVLSINFNELVINEDLITVPQNMSYEDFTSNITTKGVDYKIFNGEDEVTQGIVNKNMVLKIYKDNEEIYEYQITDEFLDLSKLTIDEENLLIKDLKLGTTISNFKEQISTSGSIKVIDQYGEELKDTDLIRSGAKVVIELSKDKYEYTLSVKGDITGTGTSKVSDVGKLYQYLRNKITMDLCYVEAGNVIDTDNEIKITDVGKLYQFIKGKIDSLED